MRFLKNIILEIIRTATRRGELIEVKSARVQLLGKVGWTVASVAGEFEILDDVVYQPVT